MNESIISKINKIIRRLPDVEKENIYDYCKEILFSIRRMSKIERQATVNIYFLNIIDELGNAVIDEAVDFAYKQYKIYPNFQAISQARKKFGDKKNG